MIPFYSKRNQVYPVFRNGCPAVEKYFLAAEHWRREAELYAALQGQLPLPAVLETAPGRLTMEYLPYPTMLAELERQERSGFDGAPWRALASWLQACYEFCGQLPGEGNLRNFLWDEKNQRVVGLDLESFEPTRLSQCGTVFSASVLEYDPVGTPVKEQAAGLLAALLDVPEDAVQEARQVLRTRRRRRAGGPVSGIILAGGASKRMGQNKAELLLLGKSLLLRQVEKMRALGIEDILLSGDDCPTLPGTRTIPDIYPNRGPLGGLHACLQAAQHSRCLVLSVDVPLVPLGALNHLCRTRNRGITVLGHGGKQEPLIGVYDREIAGHIEVLIREGGAPVRALQRAVPWHAWDYMGPEELLQNCNTPQEFATIKALAEQYAATQISF